MSAIDEELENLDHPYLIDLSVKAELKDDALIRQIEKHGRVIYRRDNP